MLPFFLAIGWHHGSLFCALLYSESGKSAKGENKECRDENRVSFFAPPKDEVLLNTWKIKIGRVDRQLSSKDKVCSLHFHEDDLRKTSEHIIDGKKIERKMKYVKLKAGAVPSIFKGSLLF